MIWHWPQITYAIIIGISLFVAAGFDGEPKTGKHSFAVSLFASGLTIFILWQGGFWAGASP